MKFILSDFSNKRLFYSVQTVTRFVCFHNSSVQSKWGEMWFIHWWSHSYEFSELIIVGRMVFHLLLSFLNVVFFRTNFAMDFFFVNRLCIEPRKITLKMSLDCVFISFRSTWISIEVFITIIQSHCDCEGLSGL